jgi:hypothetical protein
VFDFLKENKFQPFPEKHIQSFAASLLDANQTYPTSGYIYCTSGQQFFSHVALRTHCLFSGSLSLSVRSTLIIRLLGQGTFGKVVEATEKNKSGNRVAVKIIRADADWKRIRKIDMQHMRATYTFAEAQRSFLA